jgi:O-antigen/teichoic acid export membrane protein
MEAEVESVQEPVTHRPPSATPAIAGQGAGAPGVVTRLVALARAHSTYAYSIAGQALIAVASTIRLFIVGRRLTAEDYGLYAVAFAVILGCQAVFLGLTTTTLGSLAPRKEGESLKRLVTASLIVQLTAAVILSAALVAIALVAFDGRMRALLLLSVCAILASSLRFIGYPVQYSLFNFKRTLGLDATSAASQTVILVVMFYVFHRTTAEWAVATLALWELTWSVASIPLFVRFIARQRGLRQEMRDLLRFAKFSVASSLSSYSLNYGSVLILGANVAPARLGGFAASKNLARLNEPLTYALGNILRAESSAAMGGSGTMRRRQVMRTLKIGVAAATLTTILIAIFYPLGFRFLFAGKFMDFGLVVWILSFSKILESLAHFFVAILNGGGSPSLVYRSTLISGATGLVLMAVFSRWMGVYGAAISTLIAAAFFCAVLGKFVREHPLPN